MMYFFYVVATIFHWGSSLPSAYWSGALVTGWARDRDWDHEIRCENELHAPSHFPHGAAVSCSTKCGDFYARCPRTPSLDLSGLLSAGFSHPQAELCRTSESMNMCTQPVYYTPPYTARLQINPVHPFRCSGSTLFSRAA